MIDESERILMDVIHLRIAWGFLYEKILLPSFSIISDICSEAMMSTFNFNLETFEQKIVEGRKEEIGEYLCQLQLSSQDLTLLSRNDLCLYRFCLSFPCLKVLLGPPKGLNNMDFSVLLIFVPV